jgi:hypothetical protein
MYQDIADSIDADAISGSITTESAISGDNTSGILFLNHFDFAELGMGGVVADKPMDSVFIVQKLTTAFSTRWLVG